MNNSKAASDSQTVVQPARSSHQYIMKRSIDPSSSPKSYARARAEGFPAPTPAPALKKSRQEDGTAQDQQDHRNPTPASLMAQTLLVQSMASPTMMMLGSSSSSSPVAAAAIPPGSPPLGTAGSSSSNQHLHEPAAAVVNSHQKGAGGPRIRLPDKLMDYLNSQIAPVVLWWQNEEGFAFDSKRVQTEFLDKHFEKTKLKSFIRSLNRWGFRRIFYHTLPKTVYCFSHPFFKKGDPELAKDMKMVSYSGQQQAEMEEFNRQRKAPPAATPLPPLDQGQAQMQQVASARARSYSVEQPIAPAAVNRPAESLLQPRLSAPTPHPSPFQNPNIMAGNTIDAQALQLFQQQQLQQHQLAQQLSSQGMSQALFFQSMLNMANGQLSQHQQQSQSQAGMYPAASTNSATSGHLVQAILHQQQQQRDQDALAHVLGSQQRLDSIPNQHPEMLSGPTAREDGKSAGLYSSDGDIKPPPQQQQRRRQQQ